MKKKYMKLSMKVYELKGKPQLLAGSAPYDWDGPVGFAPGITPEDENHLA